MQRKCTGKAGGRRSSWKFRPVSFLIACLVLIVLACVPLLPLFALAVILPTVLRIGESIGESIGIFLAFVYWMIGTLAYSLWLLLVGDYARLVKLILELIVWLQSVGLM